MPIRHWVVAASVAAVTALAAGCADVPRYGGEPGPGYRGTASVERDAGPRYYDSRYRDRDSYYRSGEGRIVAIDAVRGSGHASGGGALLGGIAGGVLGHQIGSGRGNTAATVAGAVGGAVVGNEVEKRHGGSEYYRVTIRFDDGHEETFDQDVIGDLRVGDHVHVDNGRLFRD
ncbi:MAG TPA: glycine zipper 2TM domain-containing protein [Usitatibacter sp.]|nr:glycine zipper 2TM domain-containing protein [Usitatibacter sp.]